MPRLSSSIVTAVKGTSQLLHLLLKKISDERSEIIRMARLGKAMTPRTTLGSIYYLTSRMNFAVSSGRAVLMDIPDPNSNPAIFVNLGTI